MPLRARAGLVLLATAALWVLANAGIAAAAPPPAAYAEPAQHVPQSPLTTSPAVDSSNWSGYFASSPQAFTAVQGEWVQPSVVCPKPLAWTVFWVGLDGWRDNTVEQAGTSALCPENPTEPPRYFTWWEMYPTNSIQVAPLAVAPGQGVRASVTYIPSTGLYTMTVLNKVTHRHFTQTATCAAGLDCQRSTAEWIAERPTLLSTGQPTALADWGALSYAADKAGNTTRLTSTGKEIAVLKAASTFSETPVDMVGNTGLLASAGALTRNAFTDTWLAEE
ncbi:MAG TPA: G1 family glutamic endopeptidase [Solirubrobacteraceae bacterium]|jgi:hypothetical protein|nr:G1 family glutamic endopeptidase [Solirubrobacteraceae bacterium]